MKNSKLRRILLLLASAVLLVGLSVGATLAYLYDESEVVNNTFTVGKVIITLDELDVDEYGDPEQVQKKDEEGNPVVDEDGNPVMVDTTARVTENIYKLIPGHSYIKDPTVHVDEDSEAGWLFISVSNGIADIEDEDDTIAAQMEENGWKCLGDELGDEYNSIFYLEDIVKPGDDKTVFEQFTVSAAPDADVLEKYKNAAIVVQAYMVQADGIESAPEAYEVAPNLSWMPTDDDDE